MEAEQQEHDKVDQGKLLHGELTEKIIGVFYSVYNQLGSGFLETVYRNAMMIALRTADLNCQSEHPIAVRFQGQIVGSYFADFLVEGKVIVELKALRHLELIHEAQLMNYLRATEVEVGLLLNFGPRAQFKRFRMDNAQKTSKKIRVNPSLSVVEGFDVELVSK